VAGFSQVSLQHRQYICWFSWLAGRLTAPSTAGLRVSLIGVSRLVEFAQQAGLGIQLFCLLVLTGFSWPSGCRQQLPFDSGLLSLQCSPDESTVHRFEPIAVPV
jgi:hypothetical protein